MEPALGTAARFEQKPLSIILILGWSMAGLIEKLVFCLKLIMVGLIFVY